MEKLRVKFGEEKFIFNSFELNVPTTSYDLGKCEKGVEGNELDVK